MGPNHGIAVARKDIGEVIKKHDSGIITAYLPEQEIFAVFFKKHGWITFKEATEEWFLEHFLRIG